MPARISCAAAVLLVTGAACAGEAAPAIRILDDAGRVLLSRGEMPLAVLQLRQSSTAGVLPQNDARLALAAKALPPDGEELRQFRYPLPTGNPLDDLSVLMTVRPVAQGARVLVRSTVAGPARDNLRPGESLPAATPLEIAVEIFPDASGKLPELCSVNGEHGTTLGPRVRCLEFQGGADFRLVLARSAPAAWTLARAENFLLLRAPLLADPHQSGQFGAFVLYFGAGADDAMPELSPLRLNVQQTAARDFIEGSVRVYASGANPYALSELAVIAEIAPPPLPNGDVRVKRLPAFFWEAPANAPGEGEFRFRFAPSAPGLYGARIGVVTAAGTVRGDAVAFKAGLPASAGAVRARPATSELRLDDESVFVPLGIELSAGDLAQGAEHVRKILIGLARRGGNTARLKLSLDGLPLEARAGAFNPDVANELDEIFLAAQARDIHLLFALENAADLTVQSTRHPYFREAGGPLVAAPEFFRDGAAKRLFENRITYAAARWGAFRALFAWEPLSEIDAAWPALKSDPEKMPAPRQHPEEVDRARRARRDAEDWLEETARYLKGMDQHGHPICVSTQLDAAQTWNSLEGVENLDWVMPAEALAPDEKGLIHFSPLKFRSVHSRHEDAEPPEKPEPRR